MTATAPAPSILEFADVSGFLAPGSIAVVGASDQEGSLGGAAVRYLQKFGYPGSVWPVHPVREAVAGLKAYPTVRELPEPADLVILAVAAARIPAAIRECAAAGSRNVIVWAGGFSEGGVEGADLQQELVDICRETGVSLLGPNCIGLIGTEGPVIASFASFLRDADTIPAGNISMIGQSGGLVTMAMAHARTAGFGFRYAISTGNEAVLSAADFIAACAEDAKTEVIALYLEGTKDGEKLLAAFDLARERGKPVVLLRGGSSAAAARAAAAHTGALAGESRVWNAVLDEFGVIETRSLEELLDVVQQLSGAPHTRDVRGDGVAIVTFGGGSGVLSADQCASRGLSTPPLSSSSRARIQPLVPPIASIQNPIDLTPQVYSDAQWLEKLPAALDTVAADENVDAVLLLFGPMATAAAEIAEIARDFIARSPVPVLLSWPLAPAGISEWLREQRVNVFIEYDRAVRALAHMRSSSRAGTAPPVADGTPSQFAWEEYVPAPVAGLVVSEHNAHAVLEAAGLPVARGRLVATAAQAIAAGDEVGWPVAMKGMSETVTHKFKAGLVELGIASPEAAKVAMASLLGRADELGVELEGVYVQHMIAGGTEVLVSAFRDPVFGTMISCGAGGVLTEIIDDVVLHRAPVGPEVAGQMLGRLRILARQGAGPAELAPLSSFVSRFSELAARAPWKGFVFEVNPVKWTGETAAAVDGLLIVEEP